MAYFDIPKYREQIRKRLDESDSLDMGVIKHNEAYVKPKYESDVLTALRAKLFGTKENIVGMEDSGDATGPETHDGDTVEQRGTTKTYQEQPKEDSSAADGEEEGEPNLSADDLGDMATDTIMDILNSIKELRNEVKKKDPKKAALIRRIYDHLLKGKEKITAEILKAAEEEKASDTIKK